MKSSNNGEVRVPICYLWSPNKSSNTRNGFHIIEFFGLEVPRERSNSPGYWQEYRWLSTLMEKRYCYLQHRHSPLNTEKSSWCPPEAFTPRIHDTENCTAASKGERFSVCATTHNRILASFILKRQLDLIIEPEIRISDKLNNLSVTV